MFSPRLAVLSKNAKNDALVREVSTKVGRPGEVVCTLFHLGLIGQPSGFSDFASSA
jgi:hypothetical protein